MLLITACIILPIWGVQDFAKHFHVVMSRGDETVLLVKQLTGPVFLFLVAGWILVSTFRRKRLPLWQIGLTALGVIYTMYAVGGCSHDFSHTVFHECSDIYGIFIGGFALSSGACLIAALVVDRLSLRKSTVAPNDKKKPL
jgi:hypothetical protein